MTRQKSGLRLIGYGSNRYPTPLGDIHVDQVPDEITLVRIGKAMQQVGVTPRDVRSAAIIDDIVVLTIIARDADDQLILDGDTIRQRAARVTT